MIRVLVTAAGSELAFSVMKAVKLFEAKAFLVGCDIYKEVVGKYWCDSFYQVPLISEEEKYISELKKIITKENVNVLIPTHDMEFSVLSKYKDEFSVELGCHILVNELAEVNRFNDKWLSYLWYKKNGICSPESILLEEISETENELQKLTFPMIIKPRVGGGSRSIYKVHSTADILKYKHVVPGAILQEYLMPDNEEYTAGVYRTMQNKVYAIILKRTLKFGMTNTAEVIEDEGLINFAKNTILKTNLKGSNNIQFRVTKDGPKVLEINPRFSGTTGIRANFGFNDVEMCINEVVLKKEINAPIIKKGFVLRFMEEQYHFS